jgi:uncharacterized membrane protein YhaH (DUF805 family)
MNYESTLANPMGRTARGPFVGAGIVLLLAIAFYMLLVHAGRNGQWVMITFLYPGFVLLARRLHDMGKTAWLLAVPGLVFAAGIYYALFSANVAFGNELIWAGTAISAIVAVWGLLGKSQDGANKYGQAVG